MLSGHPDALPAPAAIDGARAVLRDQFPPTRTVPAPRLSRAVGTTVHLKLETELPTGSFKVRGALYALSRRLQEAAVSRVVASSTGNHGAAVAYAAHALGCPATVYLPRAANPVKRRRIEEYGAEVVEAGADLAAAAAAAAQRTSGGDVYYLDDATELHVPAGAATIGLEILEQVPDVECILVPVGDTALIRGVAAAVKRSAPAVRIVGVQAATAPSYYLSWQQGRPVGTETCDTIADGLATRTPVARNVAAIRDVVDDMMLVSDDDMLRAMHFLLLEEHVVAEPAGAAATAAAFRLGATGAHTVALVTGANLAPALLARVAAVTPR